MRGTDSANDTQAPVALRALLTLAEITPFGPPRAHQVKSDPLGMAGTRRSNSAAYWIHEKGLWLLRRIALFKDYVPGGFVRIYPRARPLAELNETAKNLLDVCLDVRESPVDSPAVNSSTAGVRVVWRRILEIMNIFIDEYFANAIFPSWN